MPHGGNTVMSQFRVALASQGGREMLIRKLAWQRVSTAMPGDASVALRALSVPTAWNGIRAMLDSECFASVLLMAVVPAAASAD